MQPYLSLGQFHIPLYGLVAAVGLMCAMGLGQVTARWARVDADGLWNAGVIAVAAAFCLSRVQLVVENFRMFLQYPVLVLELPSLSFVGVALALLVTLLYVRRRRMPLVGVLDAVAPCAAMMWAFLSLGLVGEGTREGMVTAVPWAVKSSFGQVHPVEGYSALGGFALCGLLIWILRRTDRRGETFAWAFAAGGLLVCGLDFFRLPSQMYGTSLLDGIQWRGLGGVVLGSVLLALCYARPIRLPDRPPEAEGPADAF